MGKERIELSDLDRKIFRISQAGKTLVPFFNPTHNWLRMENKLYYRWHLNRYFKHVHLSILGIYSAVVLKLVVAAILVVGLSGPATVEAATKTYTSQADFNAWTQSNTSATISPGSLVLGATANMSFVTATTVGSMSVDLAISPDGSFAYVVNSSSGSVSRINTSNNTVTSTISGFNWPLGVAISPDGTYAYVTNSGNNTVSRINTSTNAIVATISSISGPYTVAFTPDGSFAYATSSNTLKKIRTSDNTVVATISVGTSTVGVAVSPDGTFVYAAHNNASGTISRVRTSDDTLTATITGFSYPIEVVISPDGSSAYVGSDTGSNNFYRINTSNNTITSNITVGTRPIGLAVSPDGAFVYATDNISSGAVLSKVRVSDSTVIGTLGISGNARNIVISPDGTFAYVNHNSGTGTVSRIKLDTYTYVTSGSGATSFTPSIGVSQVWTSATPSWTTPVGTTGSLEYSHNGITWNGSIGSIPVSDTLYIRANLGTSDTSKTSSLDSIAISYSAADVTGPTYSSSATSTSGDSVSVTLTESGSLPVLPATGVTGFIVTVNGVPRTITSATVAVSPGNVVLLNLATLIISTDTVTVQYSGGNVTDSASPTQNSMTSFGAQSVTNNSTASPVDTTAPTVNSASVNTMGNTLTVNWNESGSAPVTGSTGLSLSGLLHGAVSLSSVSTTGTTTTATLSRALYSGETPSLSYSAGNFADSASSPNVVATFSGQAITNNSSLVYPTITISSPDGGEYLKGGNVHSLTWNTSGVNISSINLTYSTDNGLSYPYLISNGEANDGMYSWTLPSLNAASLRLKVEAYDSFGSPLVSDASNASFTIDSTAPVFSGLTTLSSNSDQGIGKKGDLVISYFNTSESLSNNPAVTIGGAPMTFSAHSGSVYTYSRTLDGTELSGNVQVVIQGSDLAGNTGSLNGAFVFDFTPVPAPVATASPSPSPSATPSVVTDVSSSPSPSPSVNPEEGVPPVVFATATPTPNIISRTQDVAPLIKPKISVQNLRDAVNKIQNTPALPIIATLGLTSLVAPTATAAAAGGSGWLYGIYHYFLLWLFPRRKKKYWGKLLDKCGLPIRGGLVGLVPTGLGDAVHHTVSDPAGGYQFTLSRPGEYHVGVTATGFASYIGDSKVMYPLGPEIKDIITLYSDRGAMVSEVSKFTLVKKALKISSLILGSLFWVGLVLSVYGFIIHPQLLSGFLTLLYLVIAILSLKEIIRPTLRGSVLTREGGLLANAQVHLFLQVNGELNSVATTLTNKKGEYHFKVSTDKVYVLSVTHPEFETVRNTPLQIKKGSQSDVVLVIDKVVY